MKAALIHLRPQGWIRTVLTVSINSTLPTTGTAAPFVEEVSPLFGRQEHLWRSERTCLRGKTALKSLMVTDTLKESGHVYEHPHLPQALTFLLLCAFSQTALFCIHRRATASRWQHQNHRSDHPALGMPLTFLPCSVQRRPCHRTVEQGCCRIAGGPGSQSHRRCYRGPRTTRVSKRHF